MSKLIWLNRNLHSIVVVLAITSASAAIAGEISQSAIDLEDQGEAAVDAGNLEDAEAKFEAALKIEPQYCLAAQSLSTTLYRLGCRVQNDPMAALKLFHRSLFFDHYNTQFAGKIKEQIRLAGKNPDSFSDRKQLADDLLSEKDYVGATIEYEAALSIQKNKDTVEKLAQAAAEAGIRPLMKDRVNYAAYMAAVQKKIKSHWHPPKSPSTKRVVATFSINRSGEVSNIVLKQSSGSGEDQAALTTIEQSSPFAPLPKGSPRHVDISFTFDYNVFGRGSRPNPPATNSHGAMQEPPKEPMEDQLKKQVTDQESSDKGSEGGLIKALNALAEFYINKNRLFDAEPLLARAKDLADKQNPPEGISLALTLTNLGHIYYLQGRYADSEASLKQALSISAENKDVDKSVDVRAKQIYVALLIKTNHLSEARTLNQSLKGLLPENSSAPIYGELPKENSSAHETNDALHYMRLGEDFLHKHENEQAIEHFNQAIALNPHYAYAYSERGTARAYLGKLDDAIADYTKAIELDPNLALAYTNRAWVYCKLKQWEKVATDENTAIRLCPGKALDYFHRGKAFREIGYYNIALQDLDKAIAINSSFDDAYVERGIIYHKQNKDQEAIDQYNLALIANPLNEYAYVNRGVVYESQKQYDLANAEYDQAIALNPNVPLLYHDRGDANYHARHYDKAVEDYSNALKIDPHSFDDLLQRARCYFYQHNYSQSLDDISQALVLKPNNLDALIDRGRNYAEMGQPEKAIAEYNNALVHNSHTSDANQSIIYANIANAYTKMGDQEKALSNCKRAIELNTKSATAFFHRAYAYQSLKQYQKAIEDYSQAIMLDQGFVMAHVNRGYCYSKLGQPQFLLDDSNQAIRLDPNSPLGFTNRSYANVCLGNYKQAFDDGTKAIAIDPKFAGGYCNRGKAEVKLQHYDDAINDLTTSIGIDPKMCDGSAYYYRAFAYDKLGKSNLAESDRNKAKELGYEAENVIDTSASNTNASCKQIIYDVHSITHPIEDPKSLTQSFIERKMSSNPSGDWEAKRSVKEDKYACVIEFGPDIISVDAQGARSVYDFKKKRIYVCNLSNNTYTEGSLYAVLAFRLSEPKNRLMLAKIIEKSGAKVIPSWDPVYLAASFGLDVAPDQTNGKVKKVESNGQSTYTYKDHMLTEFASSNNQLSQSDLQDWSRFLHIYCHIIPGIRIDMLNTDRLPQSFTSYTLDEEDGETTETFTLRSVKSDSINVGIPKDSKLVFDSDNPLTPVRNRIKELGGSPPKDLRERLFSEFESSLNNQWWLDAVLCMGEYSLETGQADSEMSQEWTKLGAMTNANPQVRKLMIGLAQPEDASSAQNSLSELDSIDRSKLKKGYLIDLFRANLIKALQDSNTKVITTGEPSPTKCFLKVLTANPFLVGPYHDLGHTYYDQYDMGLAWECWDLARQFAPNHPLMDDVKQIEKMCDTQMSDFINGDSLQTTGGD